MKISQLDHVAIHVRDLEASCRFYAEVLGLERMARPDFGFPGAWFRLGDEQELHLIGGRDNEVHSHSRGTHYALEVEQIDRWHERLKAAGAEFLEPRKRPDGATQIFVVDPDGHHIELCDKAGMTQG